MKVAENYIINIIKALRILCLSMPFFLISCSEKTEDEFVYDTSRSFVLRDVEYGTAARNKMNVFLPAGRNSNTRIIVLIHGGGWIAGDKNDFDNFAYAYSNAGIAAITINYRYADITYGIDYTDLLEDIGKAIQCISDSSARYTVRAEKICLLGHSAGGHLALLYAYRDNPGGLVDKVVSLAGPTDLEDPLFLSISGITELVKSVTGNDPSKRKDASPVSHPAPVKTFLYHGKSDAVVPWQQSEKLYNHIKELNPGNKCSLIENCGHGFNLSEFSRIAGETASLILNETE